jgi:hypothetical protein
MLAEELRANRDHFQREVQTKVEELLRAVRERAKIANGESDEDVGEFVSGEEASWLFDEEIGAIVGKYESLVNNILETTPGDHTYDSLRKQELDAIIGYQTQMNAHFFSQWTNEVNRWVVPCRQAAEKRLGRLVDDVLRKMPALVSDGERGASHRDNVTSEMLLTAVIQEVWVKVSACFGSKQPCFAENAVFVDATETVKQKFETAKTSLWSRYQECYSLIVRERIESLAQKAGDEMLKTIGSFPRTLFVKHFAGYPIDIYVMALNQEFYRLKDQIEQEVRRTLLQSGKVVGVSERIVQETTAEVIATLEQQISASLKGTAIQQYKAFREEIFAGVMKKAGEEFLPMLHSLAETWENREPDMDNVDPDVPYYGPTMNDVSRDIQNCKVKCEQDMVALLVGWFCENNSEYSALVGDHSNRPTIVLNASVKQNIIENIMTDFQEHTSSSSPSLAIKFLVQLSEYLQSIASPFRQEANGIIMSMEEEYDMKQSNVLEAREQAAAEQQRRINEEREAASSAATAAAAAASAAALEAEDEEALRTAALAANRSRAAASGASSAVNEQRRRAMEWAARNLTITKKPKAASPESKRAAASRFGEIRPKKSLEQQRRDAKEYARRVFGESVMRPDENEEEENSVQNASGVAVTSARGKSAIEQAKESARQLQEQRLRQQAVDAAHRAKDAAEKKKRSKA